jgi:hypothetical protein
MPARAIEEHELGLTWIAEDRALRTSHALVDDGRVWLVDPVDEPEAVARATALGEPAGVVQLLDRHERDCAALAARLGVEHLRLPTALPGSPLQPLAVVDVPRWHEVALWWPARRALVVAEALGTSVYFTGGEAPVGVHLLLRLLPPRRLAAYAPEHLLVGHGPAVHGAAAAAGLREALARSRRDLPRLLRTVFALRRA